MVTIDARLIFNLINFFILMYLLKRYLYGPITEMLDKRAEQIKNDLNQADIRKKEAGKLKEKYETELQEARNKAQVILEEAENRGKDKALEIVEKAEREAERIKAQNLEEIKQAKEDARTELQQEIVSIALLAATIFMQEKLDKKQHEKLITQYINSLDKKKLGEKR